jgi:hypothetical protein
MANGARGLQFVPVTDGVVTSLQPGQWVRVKGYLKPARFAGYTDNGDAFLVYPTRTDKYGVVPHSAFRQARNKPKRIVLGVVKVK